MSALAQPGFCLRSLLQLALAVTVVASTTGCDDEGDGDDGSDDGNADGDDIPDPVCDDLLTPSDFSTVCGSELMLEPTSFEGIELNPCNRAAENDEAILLVTRHPDEQRANAAADVAGGRGPNHQEGLGLQASAGARSVFTVEVKATDRSDAICQPDALPQLLDIALGRVAD